MAEDPQPMSIQARIAALNHAHVGRLPGDPDPSQTRMKPVVPSRPRLPPSKTANTVTNTSVGNEPIGSRQNGILPPPVITRTGQKPVEKPKPAPPPLPKRQPTQPSPAPALPPRHQSECSPRRDSSESANSAISSISGLSVGTRTTATSRSPSVDNKFRLKAPAWGDTTLPPLPPKRENKDNTQGALKSTKSIPNIRATVTSTASSVPSIPSLPPRLPPRKLSDEEQQPSQPHQKHPVAPTKVSALSWGLNKPQEEPLVPKERPNGNVYPRSQSVTNVIQPESQSPRSPPPVPVSSRPDLSAIAATKPRPSATPSTVPQEPTICLKCRDFSAPDTHAAQYPRQSLPTSDLSWLARELTSPFPSPTDKARAIFTWLHHNINYDVDAFFNHRVQPSTPANTLATGLAVCEGYASLFTALATHAGLQSVVISGHGKGFGHVNLPQGAPVPPFETNHAWNVVQIDNGEWKLIDACWGAGDVQGHGRPYNKNFKPQFFTMPNDEFGLKHFPTNKNQFYRNDGRPNIPWEEYILTDPDKTNGIENLTIFSDVREKHGIGDQTFQPHGKHISVRQPGTLHFQFGLICPHWTIERTGKGRPYVFILIIHGIDGRKDDYIPFEYYPSRTGHGGDYWALDIEARMLGAPGQKLLLFAVTNFDGRDGRGISVQEFKAKVGRCAMGFAGVAEWVLM